MHIRLDHRLDTRKWAYSGYIHTPGAPIRDGDTFITTLELHSLLNCRRYEGERQRLKYAIRLAAAEIERLKAEIKAISDRTAELAK